MAATRSWSLPSGSRYIRGSNPPARPQRVAAWTAFLPNAVATSPSRRPDDWSNSLDFRVPCCSFVGQSPLVADPKANTRLPSPV